MFGCTRNNIHFALLISSTVLLTSALILVFKVADHEYDTLGALKGTRSPGHSEKLHHLLGNQGIFALKRGFSSLQGVFEAADYEYDNIVAISGTKNPRQPGDLNHFLAKYIHVCKANDRNIGSCINNSVNHLRPKLKAGIPELNVPPMEPLILDEIKLKKGPSAAAIDCNITNLKVWGPADFVTTELKPNLQKNIFDFKLRLPRLYFKGRYEMNMNILLINVRGKGQIEGNFTNYGAHVVMKGRKILKNNQEYFTSDQLHLRLEVGQTKMRLENLFNNDPVLRVVADNMINENSDIFINEIKPALEKSLGEKFNNIANKIFLKFPYKELFP